MAHAPAHLALLDVQMPHKTGFELISEIRSHPDWKDVPIVMLTSKSHPDDRKRAMDAGADAYLLKPFEPDELLATLKAHVRTD